MLGVFLAGLTQKGPGCLAFFSDREFSEDLKRELALKSLPISGKEGDFVSVSIQEYQAVSIIVSVHAFEDTFDKRQTFVSFGVLLSPEANPTSYHTALKVITDTCRENNLLSVPVLKGIVPKLFQLAPTHILQIAKNLEVKIDFDISLTSGQRLRDALKKL
jgi:hypothetical protein